MKDDFYSITQAGSGPGEYLKIVDAVKGTQVGTIAPRGKIVTPWVISANRVSFVVERPDGSRFGTVHKLPSGSLLNQFRA